MIEKLDVKLMRLLLLLVEQESLSRVSEKLDISQQAVSLQLKNLRIMFNDQLFVRFGHGVKATPKALKLNATFDKIISELENAAKPEVFNPLDINQTFVISATDYTQQVVLVKLFETIRREAPGLKLVVKELEIDYLVHSLNEGSTDLVVTIPNFMPENLPFETLFSETYKCVINNKFEAEVLDNLQNLSKYEHLIVSPARANLKGSSLDWFIEHKVERNIVASITSFLMLPEYMKNSKMLAFIPSRMLPNPTLKEVKLPAYPPGFDVVVGWHPRTTHDPLYKWIISKISSLTT